MWELIESEQLKKKQRTYSIAEVAQNSAECMVSEVPLSEVVIEAGSGQLIEDLDRAVILLLLCREEAHLEQALICAVYTVLAFVEIGCLLITAREL